MRTHQPIERMIAVAILVLTIGQLCRADLSANMVAYYPFKGNANDASSNGYDGAVHGPTLTVDRLGNPNSAYQFDGIDDYIEVANTAGAFSLTSAWTIAAWCKPLSSLSSGTSGPVIWKTSIDEYNYDTLGLAWQPGDTWILKLERASDDEDVAVVSSACAIDKWYHVAGTYDGQFLSFYLDGILNTSHEVGSIMAYTGPAPLMIGSTLNTNHGDRGVFNGPIDDVRIYSRPLSADEVRQLAVVPVPGAILLGVLGLGYSGWLLKGRRP